MKLIERPMPNSRLNASQIKVVGSELDAITAAHGYIKPDLVLKQAEPPGAPLHDFFTWDNGIAGDKWRQEEARHLIRSIRIIRTDIPISEQPIVRKYLSVSASDTESRFDGSAYLSSDEVAASADYRQQTLNAAMAELRRWQGRHDGLREFFGIYAEIESVDRTLIARSKKRPIAAR